MEGYISEVRLFAGKLAPRSWAICNGELKNISEYSTLFSLIGTTYGGDGQTTFGLPDLQGRVPLHVGTPKSGGQPVEPGQKGGTENVLLDKRTLPTHNHGVDAKLSQDSFDGIGNTTNPKGNFPANAGKTLLYSRNPTTGTSMLPTTGPITLSATGGTEPHTNMSPYLGINYIICLEGIYPGEESKGAIQ